LRSHGESLLSTIIVIIKIILIIFRDWSHVPSPTSTYSTNLLLFIFTLTIKPFSIFLYAISGITAWLCKHDFNFLFVLGARPNHGVKIGNNNNYVSGGVFFVRYFKWFLLQCLITLTGQDTFTQNHFFNIKFE